jgi:cardiolipin synthase
MIFVTLILSDSARTGYNHSNMPQVPKLLLPSDYVSDAAKHIREAKTRVSFLSMIVTDDDSTDELIDALSDAARRGVDVEAAADMFTYGEIGGFFLPTQYRTKQSRATNRMSKRLIKSGAQFTWLGRSHATIFSGRTHIKWCVVDDTVYSFGGVNLYKEGIENIDYMFKVEDGALATKLIDEYHRLARADAGGYAYRSHSFQHGDDTILIDGGFFGDSIIYRRICKLTAGAQHVTLVSQYCPTGKFSRLLKATSSQLYFNTPHHANYINSLVIRAGMFFTGNKTLYKKSQYLHAKFIIFDMKDGRHIAITGSHNFVNAGVLLGTREIALQTENPQVIAQLRHFLKNKVI